MGKSSEYFLLKTKDGKQLCGYIWDIPEPRACVTLVHGLGEHAARYAHVAEALGEGRVIDVEVVQTSGSLTLDRRAMAIARSAAPFGRFNEAMRRQADQIVVVSRFRFTRDETLETNLTSR